MFRIKFLLLVQTFFSLLSFQVFAQWDYQLGFSARTIPFGGIFSGTLGYNFQLWGEDPTPKMPQNGPGSGSLPWKYGFIRPNITVQSIGITHRGIFELDIFPVSIFGITLGHALQSRMNQSMQFDCSQYACGDVLSRSYLRAQTIIGAQGFFTSFMGRYDSINHPNKFLPFVEETSVLLGTAGHDSLLSWSGAIGYSPNSQWLFASGVYQQRFIQSEENNWNNFLYTSHYRGPMTYTVGAGTYESSNQSLGPTVFGMIQFMGQRPLGLF